MIIIYNPDYKFGTFKFVKMAAVVARTHKRLQPLLEHPYRAQLMILRRKIGSISRRYERITVTNNLASEIEWIETAIEDISKGRLDLMGNEKKMREVKIRVADVEWHLNAYEQSEGIAQELDCNFCCCVSHRGTNSEDNEFL